jgi:hypothetical protein
MVFVVLSIIKCKRAAYHRYQIIESQLQHYFCLFGEYVMVQHCIAVVVWEFQSSSTRCVCVCVLVLRCCGGGGNQALCREVDLRLRCRQVHGSLQQQRRYEGNDKVEHGVTPTAERVLGKEPARNAKDDPQLHKDVPLASFEQWQCVGEYGNSNAHLVALGTYSRSELAVDAIGIVEGIDDKVIPTARHSVRHERRTDVNHALIHAATPVFGASGGG